MVSEDQSTTPVRRTKAEAGPKSATSSETVTSLPLRKQDPMEKACREFATYAQANLEAIMRANAAMTKGIEQLTKNFFALASQTLKEATDASKRFASAEAVGEAL